MKWQWQEIYFDCDFAFVLEKRKKRSFSQFPKKRNSKKGLILSFSFFLSFCYFGKNNVGGFISGMLLYGSICFGFSIRGKIEIFLQLGFVLFTSINHNAKEIDVKRFHCVCVLVGKREEKWGKSNWFSMRENVIVCVCVCMLGDWL